MAQAEATLASLLCVTSGGDAFACGLGAAGSLGLGRCGPGSTGWHRSRHLLRLPLLLLLRLLLHLLLRLLLHLLLRCLLLHLLRCLLLR